MRSDVAAPPGYQHSHAFYASDDDYLDAVVPFLEDGIDAGDPMFVAVSEHSSELLRAEVSEPDALTFLPADEHYLRPAVTLRTYGKLVSERVADGAPRVRAVGHVPSGVGASWEGWIRYEAGSNKAFAHLPLWALCPYDTRTVPDDVLAAVRHTHPLRAAPGSGHVPNAAFREPAVYLRERTWTTAADPFEARPPDLELVDPTPRAARAAVAERVGPADLAPVDVDDLLVGVSETVANAGTHGRPPVSLLAWVGPGRVVVTVTDHGDGPADPFAGLLPAERRAGAGGLGLWITHQVCADVALRRHAGGFTVRLVAGAAVPVG